MQIIRKLVLFFMVCVVILQLLTIDVAAKGYNTPYPRLSEVYFIDIESYPDENSIDSTDRRSEKLPYSSSLGLADRNVKAKLKHHRGMLRVRYEQRGYTSTFSIKIDGKDLSRGTVYEDETAYIPESGRFGVVAWKCQEYAINVDDTAEESEIKIVATVEDDNGVHTYTQTLTVEWIDDGGPAPESVRFEYDPASGKTILKNVNSTMEYRRKGTTNYDWKPCTDTPMEFAPSDGIKSEYHIRYAATDDEPASKATTVTLVGKRRAPSCSYNSITEVLSGLTNKMEISFSGDNYEPVPAGTTSVSMSEYIDKLAEDETLTVSVRYPLASNTPESYAYQKVIYPRRPKPDFEYDPVTLTLSEISTDMQYRLPENESWTAVYSKTLNLEKFASPEKDVTILVRYNPTSTNSASREKAVTIAKLLDGPAGKVDYANEVISGFDDDTAYQYYIGTPAAGVSWKDAATENGNFDISSLIATTAKTVNIRKASTNTEPFTYYTVFNISARPQSPTAAAFLYNDENHYGKAVLTGVTSDMEYKSGSDTSWTSVEDAAVFDIPNANTAYYVRYKATSENFASQNKSITLLKSSAAPSPAYNSTTETFTGISSAMEISYNGSGYTAVESGVTSLNMSERINELNEALTVNIRRAATSTAPASADRTVTIYPRLAAPTTLVYNRPGISLSGGSAKMQYRFENGTSWTTFPGTTFNLLSYASKDQDVKILVRYSPTTANAASLPVEFTIPKLLDGPNCSIDYINEKITGLDDNTSYQYFIGTNPKTTSSWLSMKTANGSFDISGIAANARKVINIRKAATSDEPITNYTALNLPARQTAPTTPCFVYNNEKYYDKVVLLGITPDMEYKISNDTLWKSVGNDDIVLDIPNTNTAYYVRYKSTPESFASLNKSITLYGKAAAPTPSYNTTTETITGLSTAMEVSYNGSEYTPVEASSMNMSEIIDGLTEAMTVNIRKSATSNAPASAIKTFKLYPRLAAPTTVVYNNAAISLTGINNKMQYRLETSTSWTAFSGTSFSLLSYASKDQDVKIFVRYSPTTTNAASLPVEFTIPKLLDGPNCSIDYINEKITGLDDNTSYQYFVGTNPKTTSSWLTVQTVNGNFDISGLVSSTNKTINIRKAATADEPITNYTTLILSARKAAPTTPAFVYNNDNYYDKAVLANVTPVMEYRLSTDLEWSEIIGNELVFDVPDYGMTYYIRYKATSESFPSSYKSLTLSNRKTAPNCIYNQSTQTITKLSNSMEIKIGELESYTPVLSTTYDLSDVFLSTNSVTVYIRYKATNTQSASYVQVINCDCNANVVSGEFDFVFYDTTLDDYDVVNSNEEFDNTSDDMTMENKNQLNPNGEFDALFVEPTAEDYSLAKPYLFNNDIVS